MKCLSCGQENKDSAKTCRKCQRELHVTPAWFPDAAWHLKTLGIIYVCLIILYYSVSALLRTLPRPYHLRNIPMETTPWLRPGAKHLSEDELKAPSRLPEPANPAVR